ncbi:MAG TPA: hydrogenase maturation protease [Actinomycetota bacterium]|nr:hydrogenase maturation protease [Actinomycetota bacterium]
MVDTRPAVGAAMSGRGIDIVILGVADGHGDAEAGGRVLELVRDRVPPGVRLVSTATLDREFSELDGATHVLVIDAVDVGRESGAVVLFDGDMLSPCIAQVTFRDLEIVHHLVLAGQHADAPEEIALLGVQSVMMEGDELSAPVRASLPRLAEEALGVIRSWLDRLAPAPDRTPVPGC